MTDINHWFSVIEKKDVEEAMKILSTGFDIETKNHEGRTAVHVATYYDRPEMLKFLIDRKADANAQDDNYESALMIASLHGHRKCFSVLLPISTEIDITLSLFQSSWAGYLDITIALLEAGANPFIKDWHNKTAADWAKENGHGAVLALLENRMLNMQIKTKSGYDELNF